VICEEYLTPMNYVARTRLLRHEHDTRICDKFLKLHMTRVSDTRVGYVSDTTQLLPWSVHAT